MTEKNKELVPTEKVDEVAKLLSDMWESIKKNDAGEQLKTVATGQEAILARIKDMYTRIEGLEVTVRNFMGYIKAEQADTGGQGKITQQPSAQSTTTSRQPAQSTSQLPKQTEDNSSGFSAEELDSIEWGVNSIGREWTYAHNKDGSESNNSTVAELVRRIIAKGEPITLFGYEYDLSGENGMFLGRGPPGKYTRKQTGYSRVGYGRRRY